MFIQYPRVVSLSKTSEGSIVAKNNWWVFHTIYLNYLSGPCFSACNTIPKGGVLEIGRVMSVSWSTKICPNKSVVIIKKAYLYNGFEISKVEYCFIGSCLPLGHLIGKRLPSFAVKAYGNCYPAPISSSFSWDLSFVLGKWISTVSDQISSVIAVQNSTFIWHAVHSASPTISPIV